MFTYQNLQSANMKHITLPARLAMADDNPDTREAKLRSVRRRLFFDDKNDDSAPTSKDEIERRFTEELARHQEEKKAKWNFDFKTERPIEGEWQWERIDDQSNEKQTSSNASSQDAPENADANARRISGDALGQAPLRP